MGWLHALRPTLVLHTTRSTHFTVYYLARKLKSCPLLHISRPLNWKSSRLLIYVVANQSWHVNNVSPNKLSLMICLIKATWLHWYGLYNRMHQATRFATTPTFGPIVLPHTYLRDFEQSIRKMAELMIAIPFRLYERNFWNMVLWCNQKTFVANGPLNKVYQPVPCSNATKLARALKNRVRHKRMAFKCILLLFQRIKVVIA